MTSSRVTYAALLAICLLPLLLYAPFFNEPLQRDEGFFAAVGRGLLHGDIPYRDSFDNKPPLVFAWYAFSFAILGEHAWAPRVVVSLLVCLTTLFVFIEGRLLFSVWSGLVAALAFALSIGLTRLGTNANTEYFLILPLTAGLVAFTIGWQRGGIGWFFLSGVLNGVAILTKETALFPYAFLMLFAWQTRGGRAALPNIGALAGGAIFVGLIVLAPFVVTGTADDLWDAGVVYTLEYVGDTSLGARLLLTLFTFIRLLVYVGPWMLLPIFAIVGARRAPDKERRWLLIGWLLASFVGVVLVGRLFAHYFVQLLPAAALLVPLGCRWVIDQMQRRSRVAHVWTILLTVSTFFSGGLGIAPYLASDLDERHEKKAPNDALAEFEADSPELAQYIRENTTPGDLIYNLGFQPELYFYSRRDSPTRFMFNRPFATNEDYVEEALRDLEANPPVLFIDSAAYDPWDDKDKYDRSGFDAFLAERYEPMGKMYYADIYRLRD